MKTILCLLLLPFALSAQIMMPGADAYLGASVPKASGGDGAGEPVPVGAGPSNAVQTTTLTLTLPSHQANDILIAAVGEGGGQTISCNTSGWAEIVSQMTEGVILTASFWWKRAASGAETNPEFAVGSTPNVFFGVAHAWRGCLASGSPFEDATTTAITTTTTPASAEITTTGPDRMVLCVMVQDNNMTPWTHPATGWTNTIGDAIDCRTSVGDDMRIESMHKGQPTAATVGSVTIGTVGTAEEAGSVTFALKPD